MTDADRIEHVLADQRFPAERWELITAAEHCGADGRTVRALHALPAARFRDLADVLRALARQKARHTVA